MRRRHFLGGLAALPMAIVPRAALGRPAAAIAQRATARVIVDNDFAGDPDGLVALAHQMLSPKTRTVLVTSSALDRGLAGMAALDAGKTAAAGGRLARELLQRLGGSGKPPVVTGAENFGTGGDGANAAARAIVAEALREDPLPLFLSCGGPLTNVAAALRLEPAIAGRMTLVWIGGSLDGSKEYNLSTDLAAARQVFEESKLPVWQAPAEEYRRFQVSVAELNQDIAPISPLSRWLCEQYRKLPPFVHLAGSLTFGDSPMVSLTAFDPAANPFTLRPVRRILDDGSIGEVIAGRQVRLYRGLDARLNLADLAALLRAHAATGRAIHH
jgi:hypothetical protein